MQAEEIVSADDYCYQYRGYLIWKFDGYWDVHRRKNDPQPLIEGLCSAKEARAFIDEDIKDARFMRLLEDPKNLLKALHK